MLRFKAKSYVYEKGFYCHTMLVLPVIPGHFQEFRCTGTLPTLLRLSSTTFAAAVALPRKGDLHFPQGIYEVLNR